MGRFNVSSPMGRSWEGITSLYPWVTHGKILRTLHSCKMLVEGIGYTLEILTSGKILHNFVNHVIRLSRDAI